jgi:hypothetical protein
MGLLDALLHLANFFAPGVVVGGLASSLTWLFWHRRLAAAGVRWRMLVLKASSAGMLALLLGLVVLERDGRMGSYVLMVVSVALALWWFGLRRLPLEAGH